MGQTEEPGGTGAPVPASGSGHRRRHGDSPVPRDEPAPVPLPPVVKVIFVQLPNITTAGHVNGPIGSVDFWVVEGGTRRPADGATLPHTYSNGSIELRPQADQELHLFSTTYRFTLLDTLAGPRTDRGANQRLAALGYDLHDDALLNVYRFQLAHDRRATGLYSQNIDGSPERGTFAALDDALSALASAFPITSG
jgi:hypothetical protein